MKTWHIAALVIVGLIVIGIAYAMYEKNGGMVPYSFLRPPAYNTTYGYKQGRPVYGPTRKTWRRDWGDEYPTFDDL